MSEEKALTLKQEKFCHYYVDTDGNASEAYRMAYDAAKMKAESIWVTACRLLKEPKVALRIKEIKEKRAKEREKARFPVKYACISRSPVVSYFGLNKGWSSALPLHLTGGAALKAA